MRKVKAIAGRQHYRKTRVFCAVFSSAAWLGGRKAGMAGPRLPQTFACDCYPALIFHDMTLKVSLHLL
jgi:hypothetical protein